MRAAVEAMSGEQARLQRQLSSAEEERERAQAEKKHLQQKVESLAKEVGRLQGLAGDDPKEAWHLMTQFALLQKENAKLRYQLQVSPLIAFVCRPHYGHL